MTTADQLSIVSSLLSEGGRAVSLAEGGLVQGWMKARRMLVLAEHPGGSKALIVFVSTSFPVSAKEDLTAEAAMPVDADFK